VNLCSIIEHASNFASKDGFSSALAALPGCEFPGESRFSRAARRTRAEATIDRRPIVVPGPLRRSLIVDLSVFLSASHRREIPRLRSKAHLGFFLFSHFLSSALRLRPLDQNGRGSRADVTR